MTIGSQTSASADQLPISSIAAFDVQLFHPRLKCGPPKTQTCGSAVRPRDSPIAFLQSSQDSFTFCKLAQARRSGRNGWRRLRQLGQGNLKHTTRAENDGS